MRIEFQVGDRAVIHTPDSKLTTKGPFPIRGRIHALNVRIPNVPYISFKRDDGTIGRGVDSTWCCIPDDAYMALEAEYDASTLVQSRDEDGALTGKLVPKKTHVMGLDREEISADAWKAFKDLL